MFHDTRWPNGPRNLSVASRKRLHQCAKPPEVEAIDAMISNAKLSAVDQASWPAHLRNDPVPYRADCSPCLLAGGTGKLHRRMMHPTPFSIALEIAGPFKTRGRDFDV